MTILTYPIIIHQTDENETGYWATVPDIPAIQTQGDTLQEISRATKRAIEEALAKQQTYPPATKLEDVTTKADDLLQLITIEID